jgi:hypothetical protein
MTDSKIILRHILSTISYRLVKALNNVEPEFLTFQTTNGVRQPKEIIYHMSYVITYCISEITQIEPEKPTHLNTDEEITRFFLLLKNADKLIEESNLSMKTTLKLVQGPLADILTHVGQIAMLRRIYNKPITGENFMNAKIQIGDIITTFSIKK